MFKGHNDKESFVQLIMRSESNFPQRKRISVNESLIIFFSNLWKPQTDGATLTRIIYFFLSLKYVNAASYINFLILLVSNFNCDFVF